MDQVHRIYTEDTDREDIIMIVAAKFDDFTIHTALGYYKGKYEPSVVIEIVEANDEDVEALAHTIRAANNQRSVLVMALTGHAKRIV